MTNTEEVVGSALHSVIKDIVQSSPQTHIECVKLVSVIKEAPFSSFFTPTVTDYLIETCGDDEGLQLFLKEVKFRLLFKLTLTLSQDAYKQIADAIVETACSVNQAEVWKSEETIDLLLGTKPWLEVVWVCTVLRSHVLRNNLNKST